MGNRKIMHHAAQGGIKHGVLDEITTRGDVKQQHLARQSHVAASCVACRAVEQWRCCAYAIGIGIAGASICAICPYSRRHCRRDSSNAGRLKKVATIHARSLLDSDDQRFVFFSDYKFGLLECGWIKITHRIVRKCIWLGWNLDRVAIHLAVTVFIDIN